MRVDPNILKIGVLAPNNLIQSALSTSGYLNNDYGLLKVVHSKFGIRQLPEIYPVN